MPYQIMFYGGIAGAVITLPIAIWLFIKLDIIQVLQDLTGIKLGKSNSNYTSYTGHTTSGKMTSSKILPKGEQPVAHPTSVPVTKKQTFGKKRKPKVSQKLVPSGNVASVQHEVPGTLSQSGLSVDETDRLGQTVLLGDETEETTILAASDETVLLTEQEANFVIEEDILIIHSSKTI